MKKKISLALGLIAFSIVALSQTFYNMPNVVEGILNRMPEGFEEFDLAGPPPSCEQWRKYMPKLRDPAAYKTYIIARKIWRSKIGWQLTRDEALQILHGVREASDKGDWGARALMARFYLRGLGVMDSNHVLDADPERAIGIIRPAADLGQAWALYELGVAHEYGYGGVQQSGRMAWAYFLKAAKHGSPEAQLVLANAYGRARQLDKQEIMRNCAYRQRYGPAAEELGVNRQAVSEDFLEAIRYYQDGVEYGDRDSAISLQLLYEEGYWSHMGEGVKPKFEALGIAVDLERSRRYKEIADALEINPDMKFTRLNEVLPLPPAKLPPWSGPNDALELEPSGPPTY
jgi:TPR repeat protein